MALTTVSSDRLSTNVKNTNFTAAEKQDLTDDILPLAGQLGNRNFLINGAMQHNQRVQTGTLGYYNPVTSSIYTLDRWRFFTGDSFDTNSARITKDSDSPNGFSNSWKMDIFNTQTPTSGQNAGVEQKIEAQNLQGLGYGTSAAKTMTLSFYVKSFKTGTYCVQIFQADPLKYQLHEYTINQSDTWERKTITIPGNTSDAINNDNGIGLRIAWHLVVGSGDHASATSSWVSGSSFKATSNQVNLWDNSNNNWFLTGCQLEIGTVTTDFEHRSFDQELNLCQRYFQKYVHTANEACIAAGLIWVGTQVRTPFMFLKEMRVAPSFTSSTASNFQAANGDQSRTASALTLSSACTTHAIIFMTTASGLTQSNPIFMDNMNNGGTGSFFALDSEL